MPTDKPKISTYLPVDIYEKFREIARAERRSGSGLLYKIVLDFIDAHNTPPVQPHPYIDTTALLQRILYEPLTDTAIIVLSHDYDLQPKLLIELRDRLTPPKINGNGHEITRQS